MSRKLVVAVDVDLTVVDSLTPWLNWFYNKTGIKFEPSDTSQYDLVPLMVKSCREAGIEGFSPFDYWKDANLYDMMTPMAGAKEVLAAFKDDIELAFTSHCVPAHEDSKRLFLKRHFIDHSFVSTKDKWLVNYDVIVDDNSQVLREGVTRRPDAVHVQFNKMCPWTKPVPNALLMNDWSLEKFSGILSIARQVVEAKRTIH